MHHSKESGFDSNELAFFLEKKRLFREKVLGAERKEGCDDRRRAADRFFDRGNRGKVVVIFLLNGNKH